MNRRFFVFFVFLLLFAVVGCATDSPAEKAGEAVGTVMSVPNSVSEGAAGGIAGKPETNPYNR